MNVYDFDNTIYDGESVFDFYIFLLRKNFSLIRLLPKVLSVLIKYKRCVITGDELMEIAQRYAIEVLESLSDVTTTVAEFWDKNQHKIKKLYLENQREDDVILSASAGFLIGDVCQRIGIKTVLASEVDLESGKIGRICFSGAKPEIFRANFPDAVIENFYTDSMNDKPMFEISENVYLVKGNKIKKVK